MEKKQGEYCLTNSLGSNKTIEEGIQSSLWMTQQVIMLELCINSLFKVISCEVMGILKTVK